LFLFLKGERKTGVPMATTYEKYEEVGVGSPACDDRHPILLEIQIRVGRL
jgi:hypothetical protein